MAHAKSSFSSPERTTVALQTEPLSLDAVLAFVNRQGSGGLAFFVGCVRPDVTPAGRVEALEYEAYPGVAEKLMLQIGSEALARFGADRVALVHRVGRLVPGEASVIVAAGCAHKAEAFAACSYLIDELKRRVPVWKREWVGEQGSWAHCTHDAEVPSASPEH